MPAAGLSSESLKDANELNNELKKGKMALAIEFRKMDKRNLSYNVA